MLSRLVAFEWRYQTRQPAFWAAAVLFLALGLALAASGFGPDNLPVNSPYVVTQSLAFLSLISVFAASALGAGALLRDGDHGMTELVHSTPVGASRLLLARFLGAYLAASVAFALAAAGMLAGSHAPWLDPARVAPFDLAGYLWPLATVALPSVLFASAALLAIAAATRSALATHVGAVLVYGLYFVAAALSNSPLMAGSRPGAGGGGIAAALLDPFALSAFFAVTEHWTLVEKSSRLVPLAGPLLWNRLLWVAVSMVTVALTLRVYSFRQPARRRAGAGPTRRRARAAAALPYHTVAPRPAGLLPGLASFRSAAVVELRAFAGTKAFAALLVVWMAIVGVELVASLSGEYGALLYPTSTGLARELVQPIMLLGAVLVVAFAAESYWRERRAGMAPIVDAAPVGGATMVAAKLAALATALAAVVASGIAVAVGLQLVRGATLELAVYLSLFYFAGAPLVLFAAAALAINAVSPGKYAGMVATLAFIVVARRAASLGLTHPLWRFGWTPPVGFTEMNGVGSVAAPFAVFLAHWSLVAGLLLLLAAALWREAGTPARARLRALAGVPARVRALAGALAVAALATGGWIHYNTTVLNDHRSQRDLADWKEGYERTYRPLASRPQPAVAAVNVGVDLYPAERRCLIRGSYRLVNETGGELREVNVAVRRDALDVRLSLASAPPAAIDERYGMYRFALGEPLAAGAAADLDFALILGDRGFVDGPQDDTVLANGTTIMSYLALPTLGYRASYEIIDPRERARRGLPAADLAPPEQGEDGLETSDSRRVVVATTVSTAGDQTAIAPGRLERSWERDGRRYFSYRTERPIVNRFAFVSARYAIAARRHRGVDIELYHHPGHTANVGRILDSAAASLDEFSAAFGPYPLGELRLAEVPSHPWGFAAFALPGMVLLVEDRSVLLDVSDPGRPDLLSRRVAHEVAHQWWGYQLVPPDGPGASVLVESLAKYSELKVTRRLHGAAQARRFLEMELDRYLAGRGSDPHGELPLARVGRQGYISYAKGSLVMYSIRDLIGERALDAALRRLLGHPAPTSLDLVAALRQPADGRDAALVEDWLRRIILYDLEVEAAVARPMADGRWEVTVTVAAARRESDGAGRETPLDLDEAIDVAVLDGDPGDPGATELLRESRPLRSGRNELTMVVDRPPAWVSVDPDLLRIETNRGDNLRAIEPR